MFENMQMNMNSGRKMSNTSSPFNFPFSSSAKTLMTEDSVSPWDRRVFKVVQEEMGDAGGVELMRSWLVTVMVSNPSCLVVLPCLAMQEWLHFDTTLLCRDKSTCSLFDPDF